MAEHQTVTTDGPEQRAETALHKESRFETNWLGSRG